MRVVPQPIIDALTSREFTGNRRAVTRVTIQKTALATYQVGDDAVYSSIMFAGGGASGALELPNVRSVSWQRSTDDAVATCHLELFNTAPLPAGSMPPLDDAYDQLGYYTYNRASTPLAVSTWGHLPNKWQDYLVPDRVIRVYQGYGADYTVYPEDDPHLVLMGCFITDEVTYAHDGSISVDARDYGRLLMDQVMFPPVVPLPRYPLSFDHYHDVPNPPIVTTTGSDGWKRPSYDTDSGVPYNGRNGTVSGHHGSDAFDGSESSYWLSVGNARPDSFYAYEFIQGAISGKVSGARCHVWGGPYTVYLSIRVGNTWQGTQKIPYDPNRHPSAPNGADIMFSQTATVGRDGEASFTFDTIDNVTAVRFTFTDLFNSGIGTYRYRAGVRTFEVLSDTRHTTTTDGGTHVEGNYESYSDIAKLLLAYGGFWWPPAGRSYQTLTASRVREIDYTGGKDPYLADGQLWADVEIANAPAHGTLQDVNIEVFNMKPLMDGITYLRDLIGFNFWIDENGAAVFRLPNYFKRGSNTMATDRPDGKGRTSTAITLKDDEFILSLRSRLSSKNSRERVVVANLSGQLGAVAYGRPLQEVNFRRVSVYSDQNFTRQDDVAVMADLIALRQRFTYRQNTLQIAADPRIQIDDQVQIQERTTGDNYLHYVSGISSDWSLADGKWTFDLTTSWLGTDPEAEWAFKTRDLQQETLYYLTAMGQV